MKGENVKVISKFIDGDGRKTQMSMMDARAPCRAVLAKLDGPGAHGNGQKWGKCNRGSRHGVMAEAGKLGMARQAHAKQAAAAQQAGR